MAEMVQPADQPHPIDGDVPCVDGDGRHGTTAQDGDVTKMTTDVMGRDYEQDSACCPQNDDNQKKRFSISRSHKFRRQIRRKSTVKDGSLSQNGGDLDKTPRISPSDSHEHSLDSEGDLSHCADPENNEHSMDRSSAKDAFKSRNMHSSFDKYQPPEHQSREEDGEEAEAEVEEYHLDESEEPHEEQSLDTALSKTEARIKNICQELLDTEERYVSRLEDLVSIKQRTGRLLSEGLARSMFLNVDVIHQLHNGFLPSLRHRIQNWTPGSHLGDLMQKMTPFLKLYTEYVKNFQTASQLVQLWKGKNFNFNKLLNDYSCRNFGGLDIGGRMIEPVQRVPRYELLLKDYMKRLPEDSTDRENVQKSLEKVSEAAKHFETMMQRDARIAMLGSLQRSLDGAVNIFSFSRELIKTADITVVNSKLNRTDECSMYLFNDLLLITKEVHYMTSVRKKVKHLIDLAKVKVTQGSSCLVLVVSTRNADVEIEFGSLNDVVEWQQSLRHQIAESNKKKLIRRGTWHENSSTKTLGHTAPTFVLPHTVSVCMSCGCQFDTQKRKKNCAACGMVVCGRCSPHRMLLLYDKSDPKRVCHSCHTIMNKDRTFSLPSPCV